jgi:hypothetical protein
VGSRCASCGLASKAVKRLNISDRVVVMLNERSFRAPPLPTRKDEQSIASVGGRLTDLFRISLKRK